MKRVIRFTDEAGDQIGTATIDNPGLATRLFQHLEETGFWTGLELETSKGNVIAASFYDPEEINGVPVADLIAEDAMIEQERKDAGRG